MGRKYFDHQTDELFLPGLKVFKKLLVGCRFFGSPQLNPTVEGIGQARGSGIGPVASCLENQTNIF